MNRIEEIKERKRMFDELIGTNRMDTVMEEYRLQEQLAEDVSTLLSKLEIADKALMDTVDDLEQISHHAKWDEREDAYKAADKRREQAIEALKQIRS